jgi:hypothetical protein
MEHKPALYALIKPHADLGGRIKQNRTEVKILRRDMVHVEAVLKMLDPGFSVRSIAARRKNNPTPLFKRGTLFRAVLGVLREAAAPMTADDIGLALFRSRGVEKPPIDQRRRLYGAVNSGLENHRGKMVERDDGSPRRWHVLTAP